ncbi:MAG: hypothetical protein LBD86_05780, partial [Spirochaetaceae bacterium]|nr:hypothetical protein [Spirochaetaceae bacterium]
RRGPFSSRPRLLSFRLIMGSDTGRVAASASGPASPAFASLRGQTPVGGTASASALATSGFA